MPPAEDVWVTWSVYSNLHTKNDTQNAHVVFAPGERILPNIVVHNNQTTAIYNVTLLVLSHNVTYEFFKIFSTHVLVPPTEYYARWPHVEPNDARSVPIWFQIHHEEKGPFALDFVVIFQNETGEHHHSVTRIQGMVQAPSTPQWSQREIPMTSLVVLLGVLLLAHRARRPKSPSKESA